jgi:hypothetical protein
MKVYHWREWVEVVPRALIPIDITLISPTGNLAISGLLESVILASCT